MMTPDDQELAARRAALAQANIATTLSGTVMVDVCKRCGQVMYQYVSHTCPDFDEPMELVESQRLRALERVHQATCPNCGQPMAGGTPAQDAPTMPPTKQHESWRDRPPLL